MGFFRFHDPGRSLEIQYRLLDIAAYGNAGVQIETPHQIHGGVFDMNSLAVTYFRMQKAYYHWRWFVSRPCSRWEGVVPNRYGRQA